ncbi:MAG: alpha-glucosidase [Chloroflexi bacterium]|nr:alpha-glucosidase [Chloroflexota bacterium]
MTQPDFLWWRDGVIYQIYPRSFMDSNGDGIGDLPGLISRLDYIADLGVDALWLSPINVSPMHDFGYDIADYEDIDPIFGARADYDTLIAEAHRRGLKVMMDLVINHTSSEHPWFKESRSSRDNPKADWYIWRDKAPGGNGPRPPNNWASMFGGSGWEWDETRGQFYFHIFLKEQPDFNWRNPEARAAMMNMIRFWLERGVDGFRLDVVNAYFKDAQFRDNPERFSLDPRIVLPWFRQKHIYDYDQPELHDIYSEFRRLLDSYPTRGSVGEIFENQDPQAIAGYLGRDQLHMAFNFEFTHQPWLPRAFQQSIMKWDAALGPDGDKWPCYVLSNHDNPRHVTRHGGGPFALARAKVAATLLLTLRGTPFLYYGEELGMPSPRLARKDLVDPPSKKYWPFFDRDSARTPMQWDDSPNAGFTSGKPWLPVGPSYKTLNVAAQKTDPHSVLNFYRALLRLRRQSPALRRGRYRLLAERPVNAMTYLRETEEQTMLVALNFFGHHTTAPVPAGKWRRVLSTHIGGDPGVSEITLAPFEASLFELASR